MRPKRGPGRPKRVRKSHVPKRRAKPSLVEVRGNAEIALDSFLHHVGARLVGEGLGQIRQEVASFEGTVNRQLGGGFLLPLERRIGAYRSFVTILGEVVGRRRQKESVMELVEMHISLRKKLAGLENQWHLEHRSRLNGTIDKPA